MVENNFYDLLNPDYKEVDFQEEEPKQLRPFMDRLIVNTSYTNTNLLVIFELVVGQLIQQINASHYSVDFYQKE